MGHRPDAVAARLIDTAGHTLEDRIERGVAVFLWTDQFNAREARLELIDANGRVSRDGRLFRSD